MKDDDPYTDPQTGVLKNKLGLRSAAALDKNERRLVTQRMREGVPTGNFDLAHLKAIHRHLFQDVYAWAGEIRTVEMNKDGSQFQFRNYIETGMADVHRRLEAKRFLRGTSPAAFAKEAGAIMGDVNYVHPFREGNGRTQLQYLKQLAERAGHSLDLEKLKGPAWIEASRAANTADYAPMAREIASALQRGRAPSRSRDDRER